MGCERCGREWGVKGGGGGRRVEGKAVNAEQTPGCHTRHARLQSFKRSHTHRYTDAMLCM